MNTKETEIPHICETCGKNQPEYDITMKDEECGGCCSWNDRWEPKK